jgi:hypothetical protein
MRLAVAFVLTSIAKQSPRCACTKAMLCRESSQISRPNDDLLPQRKIIGYHTDEERHWVAELSCGHFQHVRHDPPMTERTWVLTEEGRNQFLGYPLKCVKCARGQPKDAV